MTAPAETVYCRRCRSRHKVVQGRAIGITARWWYVDCPRRDSYVVPMRHETTGRWVPL